MGASVRPDPVADYLAAKGGSQTVDPVSDYLAAKGGSAVTPHGASGTFGDEPGPGAMAHFLNFGQGIPGVERLEAGAGAIGSHVVPGMFGGKPISYDQSLAALRSVTGQIDPKTAAVEKFLGAMTMAPFLPANPALAGAALGATDQALSADPITSPGERVGSTLMGAGVGALAGKVADQAITAGRSLLTPTLGAQQVALDAARKAADKLSYGAAKAEGDVAGPNSGLLAVFQDPNVQPFVDLARSSPKNANANDADLARYTYKLMSREQNGLLKRMADQGYDANLATKADILAGKKQELLSAATQSMPSLPAAIAQHAKMKGEEAAMQQGADVAQSVFSARHIAGRKLAGKSVEAFANDAQSMTPQQLQQAAMGILGRLKENPKLVHLPVIHAPIPFPSRALQQAPGLLRSVEPNATPYASYGLLGLYGASR